MLKKRPQNENQSFFFTFLWFFFFVFTTGFIVFQTLKNPKDVKAVRGDLKLELDPLQNLKFPGDGIWTSAGNVGIGTETPNYKLHVHNGKIYSTGGSGGEIGVLNPDNQSAYVNLSWLNNIARIRVGGSGDGASNGLDIQGPVETSLLRITGGGNVGIGTTSPGYKLTIAGSNTIFGVDNMATFASRNSSGTYENYLWPRWSDNIMYLNYGSSGFNIRNNNSVSTMFMTSGGNVGIGTTSPGYKLHVAHSGDSPLYVTTSQTTSVHGARFYAPSLSTGNAIWTVTGVGTGSYNHAHFGFYYAGNSSTSNALRLGLAGIDVMTLVANGNVGIGTTSPGAKLEVIGTIRSNYASNEGGNIAIVNTSKTGATTRDWRLWNMTGNYGNKLTFWRYFADGTNAGPSFELWDNGRARFNSNVGIRVDPSGYALDVGDRIRLRAGSAGTAGLWLFNGSADIGFIGDVSNGHIGLWGNTGANWGLVMNTSNGNVGIGTTSPGYKLQVVGSLYAGGSSKRYKTNIKPLTIDSSKIYQLKPVSFEYKPEWKVFKKDIAGGQEFGLIAEDVAQIFPELTLMTTENGVKKISNVDYEKISVLLIQEMKKHQEKIIFLEKENRSLKEKLEQLEKRIDKLENN